MARHSSRTPPDAGAAVPAARSGSVGRHSRQLEIRGDLPVSVQVTPTTIYVSSAFTGMVRAIYLTRRVAQAPVDRILRLVVMHLGEQGIIRPARVTPEQYTESIRLTLLKLADIDELVQLPEAFYA